MFIAKLFRSSQSPHAVSPEGLVYVERGHLCPR
jgi:hypothetical protein